MPQIGPITENDGRGFVVMGIHEEMLEIAATDTAIVEAEAEYAKDGILYDAREVFAALRQKYFSK